MRASIFISFFCFVTFGETCLRGMKEDVQDQAESKYQPFYLIIALGSPYDDARRTETFKWQNEDNSTCKLPDYSTNIPGAVPVSIRGTDYFCGGYPYKAQCFNILTGDEAPFSLLRKRAHASSATTNDTVIIFGGNDPNDLASYETISTDYVQSEGVLPFRWQYGCSTLINSTTILLAGGLQNGTLSSKTWFFNFKTKEWAKGPSMSEERSGFGCGLIRSINSVAVFGSVNIATTEIVKLPGGSFKKGNHQFLLD